MWRFSLWSRRVPAIEGMSSSATTIYRGRFAPSPTGPLHFGSLIAAVGSYLQARSHGGIWRVRMEDIDPPREQPGAADAILRTLEAHGLHWDGEVLYQHTRPEAYQDAIERLRGMDMIYACRCSRKTIAQNGRAGPYGMIYPGTCRDRACIDTDYQQQALRVVTEDHDILFRDALLGTRRQNLAREVGDFIIRRADGLFAYQLAVVVDDAAQGITEVVRGSDLLDQTPRQIHLQNLLNLPTPGYLHLPLAVGPDGAKLSKQTHAPAVDNARPIDNLLRVLAFLGQGHASPADFDHLDDFWAWATASWDQSRLPASPALGAAGPW